MRRTLVHNVVLEYQVTPYLEKKLECQGYFDLTNLAEPWFVRDGK